MVELDKKQIREIIARRAALELKDNYVVNLGIGIPTFVANYIPEGVNVTLQSENGLLGMGAAPSEGYEDFTLTNAGGGYVTAQEGASTFHSAYSFAIIRGGHVDVTMLGALQVDAKGNLANWMIPGKKVPGMGGAMDLIVGAKKVILTMEHTANGNHKILEACNLPLTAASQVDMIITEMGVMNITDNGIELVELNPQFTIEEIQAATGCTLIVSDSLIDMRQ